MLWCSRQPSKETFRRETLFSEYPPQTAGACPADDETRRQEGRNGRRRVEQSLSLYEITRFKESGDETPCSEEDKVVIRSLVH